MLSKIAKRLRKIWTYYRMIQKIKIYGERNSGTTFLNELLCTNCVNIKMMQNSYSKNGSGWKHGFPNIDLFRGAMKPVEELDTILFVFIIRDLDPWLKSMYQNPYHFKKLYNMTEFINSPMIVQESDTNHDIFSDKREHDKQIIDLRNNKIKHYLHTFGHIKNGIIINLEDIQKDNGEKFIHFLHDTFHINTKIPFTPISKHTKCNKTILNREYDVILPRALVDSKMDTDIEEFVQSLKEQYYFSVCMERTA